MPSASEIPISSVIEFANNIDKLSELQSLASWKTSVMECEFTVMVFSVLT